MNKSQDQFIALRSKVLFNFKSCVSTIAVRCDQVNKLHAGLRGLFNGIPWPPGPQLLTIIGAKARGKATRWHFVRVGCASRLKILYIDRPLGGCTYAGLQAIDARLHSYYLQTVQNVFLNQLSNKTNHDRYYFLSNQNHCIHVTLRLQSGVNKAKKVIFIYVCRP